MEEKLSIIIPVYNVEDFLEESILSVLNQTYKNLEILLINDGSTDNSLKICKKYGEIDRRIKIINQENKGLSGARNTGIENSTGKYLIFLDSDDTLDEDICEVLKNKLDSEKADIVICDLYSDRDKKNAKEIVTNYTSKEVIREILIRNKFDTSACGKIFKRELFDDIFFPEGKLYEDLGTIYKIVDKANKITHISVAKYFYRVRKGSITRSKFNLKQLDVFYFLNKIKIYLKNNYPDLLQLLRNRESLTIVITFLMLFESNKIDKRLAKKLCKKLRINIVSFIKDKNINFIYKILAVGIIVNYNITKFLVQSVRKIKL